MTIWDGMRICAGKFPAALSFARGQLAANKIHVSDVVDTRSHRADVRHMFMGSISPLTDAIEDD